MTYFLWALVGMGLIIFGVNSMMYSPYTIIVAMIGSIIIGRIAMVADKGNQ